jgi:hypothetical protein
LRLFLALKKAENNKELYKILDSKRTPSNKYKETLENYNKFPLLFHLTIHGLAY